MPPYDSLKASSRAGLVRDPVYQQLNELLQALIRSGEYKAGDQFLTERQVGERFGVSRVTANKALSHLVVEGVLEFRKGVGSFVRDGVLDHNLRSLVSFTSKAAAAGMTPGTRVLQFRRVPAGKAAPDVMRSLRVGAGVPLFYCERLRLADGEPVILERRYIVERFCPGLTRASLQGSLYALLEREWGIRVTGAEQSIRALGLPEGDARLLGVKRGSAALWVRGIGLAGDPLWLESTLYRADRYEFLNSLGTHQSRRPARPQLTSPAPFEGFEN